MSEPNIDHVAREDFNRARGRETLSRILNILTPERQELLSLQDVRELIRPKGESYVGMRTVPIDLIVGSEGRYRDFDNTFLPRYDYIRSRWESVDRAHLKDIVLPPITLYEIGGVYFVRDGNHRVSVARSQGVEEIDAEVISLRSHIKIKRGMTRQDLKRAVIGYEKKTVFEQSELGKVVRPEEIDFTATGRYEELLRHILVHKYYMNLDRKDEIPFVEAAKSWYDELFLPIVELIQEEHLLARFPGRTEADLYMWLIGHWDALKRKYGNSFSLREAVLDYARTYGRSQWQRVWERLSSLFRPRRSDGPRPRQPTGSGQKG